VTSASERARPAAARPDPSGAPLADVPGHVVVVGDVMNDVVVRPSVPVCEGSDTDSEVRHLPGGSGANQAAWLARCGVPVRFYGRAGAADAASHAEVLRGAGVDAAVTADPELPTGSIVVLVAPDGDRTMFTDRGANRRLGASDLPGDLRGARHLHVSGYALFEPPAQEAVAALVAWAAREALGVSCDPSSVAYLRRLGAARFVALTRGVGTLFPNAAEARVLAGMPTGTTDEEVAVALTRSYPVVAVKLGAEGALLATRDGRLERVPAPAAAARDTTGAGDAFCAGYLSAMLGGAAPHEAVRAAVALSAVAVAHLGGRPPDPAVPTASARMA